MNFIDTHAHLDGKEFDSDRKQVVERAKEAGATKIFVPAIDLPSLDKVEEVCNLYADFAYPMVGLHPEEVRGNYNEVLDNMQERLPGNFIAIGEVGLDFYWSREFEKEQMEAFERQVEWACQMNLPLMIHSRKAQNQLVAILKKYKGRLNGGVFHCFTGNLTEAKQLLEFDNFCLGIGGVLTFKKSNLPEVVKQLPLQRIVLETDAPYMAPVPMRGKRNESAFITHVIEKMAQCYGIEKEVVADTTTQNALRTFPRCV
ncbi:MAG: TatD family hydrolase [Prevotella sp.]|nr:TatD family hydrolase [Prevotella sp.]